MAGMRFTIRSEADLIKAINKYGFLTFFRNSIEGFSIEEHRGEYWNIVCCTYCFAITYEL